MERICRKKKIKKQKNSKFELEGGATFKSGTIP